MNILIKKTTKTTHILFIVLAVVIIYANSLNYKFVWDDLFLIVDNPYIKNWDSIDTVFTKSIYCGANKTSNYYRPLQVVSYMADYSLWKLNPFGFHLTNILLHAINSILVYLLIFTIFGSSGISLLTALLFASAPVISSATYYIASRADLLAALFMLVSVLTFIVYDRRKKGWLYIVSILSFILALLSRESAVILPFLLMAVFFHNRKINPRIFLRRSLPYFLVLLTYVLARITILNFNTPGHGLIESTYVASVPLLNRLLTELRVLIIYIRLLLFPFGLHMNRLIEPAGSIFQPAILFSAILLVLIAVGIKRLSRNYPAILFGVIWFFIALFPVLNIYPLSAFLHDTWLYLPSIGFYFLLSIILLKVVHKRFGRIVTNSLMCAFLLYFTAISVLYGKVWRDDISIFKHTVRYNPKDPLIHGSLALAYFNQDRCEEAIRECKYALSLDPGFSGTYNNLGIFYAKRGDYAEAIKNFKTSIKLDEGYAAPYLNLALTFNTLGYFNKALDAINKSIGLSPDYYRPYSTLGVIYFNMDEFYKAEKVFNKVLTLNRDSFEAHHYLGTIYLKKAEIKKALKEYGICLRLNEGSADFYNNLAILYIRLQRFKDAEDVLIYAKELDGNYVASYNNLGNLYAGLGMFDLAIVEYKKALSLRPDNFKIYLNLAKTYKDLCKATSDRSFYYKAKKAWKKASNLALRNK